MNPDGAMILNSIRKMADHRVFEKVKNSLVYQYRVRMPREQYASELTKWYHRRTGKALDLANPQTLCEKIQWCKLYDSTPAKTRLADKYLVREWVAEQIGAEYLTPLFGTWESFEAIDFDALPDRFVLKANHGSHWNMVVNDKTKLDRAMAKQKFERWLDTNYAFFMGFELQYKNIPPRIIAEQNLNTGDVLHEYKILCFDGEPRFLWDDAPRFRNGCRNVYDANWNVMPFTVNYPSSPDLDPKPRNLATLISIARKLSRGFCHVRVDLYETEGKIYFGEMTFTPGSGLWKIDAPEWDLELGNLVNLPDRSPVP